MIGVQIQMEIDTTAKATIIGRQYEAFPTFVNVSQGHEEPCCVSGQEKLRCESVRGFIRHIKPV